MQKQRELQRGDRRAGLVRELWPAALDEVARCGRPKDEGRTGGHSGLGVGYAERSTAGGVGKGRARRDAARRGQSARRFIEL